MKKKSNLNKNFLFFFRKIYRPLLDRVVKSLKPTTNRNSSTYVHKNCCAEEGKGTRKRVKPLIPPIIKTPLKLYKVNIIEIARGHGVTVSDEIGLPPDFLLNADLFMEY